MATIEIDLNDFDDDEIAEEFYARGLDDPEENVDTRLKEVFIEFESGRIEESMILLERIFPRLRGLAAAVAQ
jgi:hypothetical protein